MSGEGEGGGQNSIVQNMNTETRVQREGKPLDSGGSAAGAPCLGRGKGEDRIV